VQSLCDMVAKRAARLAAVGIAAVVTQMGTDGTDIVAGIDGSVFKRHPRIPNWMREALAELDIK